MIRIKRVYAPPARTDGTRILVDRIWPRGLARDKAQVHVWMKDLAPSSGLRTWFGHDPDRWAGFKERFFTELDAQKELVDELLSRRGTITLVYGSREERFNNAAALREYLDRRVRRPARKKAA